MKTFTDLEQSKKLAEILPLDSADMVFAYCDSFDEYTTFPRVLESSQNFNIYERDIPCWSLAALLSVIPKRIKEDYIFRIDVGVKDSSIWYDELSYGAKNDLPDITAYNIVDACYEMIIKLHELNLLEL